MPRTELSSSTLRPVVAAATIRVSLAAAALLGCAPERPVPHPPASVAASSAPAPSALPTPATLPANGMVSAVAYDAADDAITLCPPPSARDPRCARVPPRGAAVAVDRPATIPPAVRAPNLVLSRAPKPSDDKPLKQRGSRVIFDGADRWVDLPALPRAAMPVQPAPRLFWMSRDGSRALVWRTGARPPTPDTMFLHLDVLDLVDPVAHRVLARDESCGGFYGLGDLFVDADERALLVGMQQDTAEPWAVVDLPRERFGVVRAEAAASRPKGAACADFELSSAWSDRHAPPGALAADVTQWRFPTGIVALDTGRVTALVSGDFPEDIDAIEYLVDSDTSVVVAPARAGRVRLGVLHRAPAVGVPRLPAPSGAGASPRSVPATVP